MAVPVMLANVLVNCSCHEHCDDRSDHLPLTVKIVTGYLFQIRFLAFQILLENEKKRLLVVVLTITLRFTSRLVAISCRGVSYKGDLH